MALPPLDPELRDSIRNRLRLCLNCRQLKRWSLASTISARRYTSASTPVTN